MGRLRDRCERLNLLREFVLLLRTITQPTVFTSCILAQERCVLCGRRWSIDLRIDRAGLRSLDKTIENSDYAMPFVPLLRLKIFFNYDNAESDFLKANYLSTHDIQFTFER